MPGLLFAQIGRAVPSSALDMVTGATGIEQVVLLFLAVLSLTSWAIMLAKWREFAALTRDAAPFLAEAASSDRFDQVVQTARLSVPTPYTQITQRAAQFLEQSTLANRARGETALSATQVEALKLLLDAEADGARERLVRFVPWLATIGSVSPLLGLLGTVLGVIDAFLGIATKGSGNLAAVAPGIATALIATAAALAVAIPASFGYNLFASRLSRLESGLDGFGSELIARLAREGRL
ncbi:MAG: MotA/TolQ/ExbB proton channel family protein [Gemmatimonadaceae bacterium]|nr:MotA/TolQ/ExbB proton channel family protein [Gemmatimonadaceae bacterium]